jgi:glutaredoxin 3
MGQRRIRIFTTEACSFCTRAKRLLAQKGVAFEEIWFPRSDVQARRDLVELTGRYTVPQVLVDETPIGGYQELRALEEDGRLDLLLGVA